MGHTNALMRIRVGEYIAKVRAPVKPATPRSGPRNAAFTSIFRSAPWAFPMSSSAIVPTAWPPTSATQKSPLPRR